MSVYEDLENVQRWVGEALDVICDWERAWHALPTEVRGRTHLAESKSAVVVRWIQEQQKNTNPKETP